MADSSEGHRRIGSLDPWRFQRWAFGEVTGNPARKAVFSMLAMQADSETGRCEAKQGTLAVGCELSERAVRSHLKALEDAGLIARRPQFRRDRGRRGDEFLLLAPWIDEWPDGEPARVHPADPAGGSDGQGSPPPPEAGDRPPRKPASGQEQPLGNGLSGTTERSSSAAGAWESVPDDLRIDAETLLSQKVKVNSRLVTEAEMRVAAAALAEFNRQAESDFGLGAHLTPLVMRVRERPSWDASKHVRLVQSAWRLKWWTRRRGQRRPTPAVIYGNPNVFEQVAQDAKDEASGRRIDLSSLNGSGGRLKEATYSGGRTWDELTPNEQAIARDNAAMGVWPDEERDAAPTSRVASGVGVTAATFLDDE